ncbi:hypothetical protein Dimus_023323 [Dionaea muscipula]
MSSNMMTMTFGWIKIRTTALQLISADVTLLNNGTSSRIQVTEESVFNLEQWVQGSAPLHGGSNYLEIHRGVGDGSYIVKPLVPRIGLLFIQRSHFVVIPAIVAECPPTGGSGSKGFEACEDSRQRRALAEEEEKRIAGQGTAERRIQRNDTGHHSEGSSSITRSNDRMGIG